MNNKAQTIFRAEKNPDNPFVMIDRRAVENPKLSWRAKGLLAYLLSRPDDWVVRFKDLAKRAPDGAHTIRAAMKELKAAGHVEVITEREGGKITKWIYKVHEVPHGGFQQVEKQDVENRTYSNTKSTEKDLKEIYTALENLTGGLNSNTPRFVDTLKEKHSTEWILKAISIAFEKRARSMKYVDTILIGWEANGYPKSREERVKEMRGNGSKPSPSTPPADDNYAAELEATRARLRAQKANAVKVRV